MTYSNSWFGALTGWSFWYGCMIGIMVPPSLRPAQAVLFAASKDACLPPIGAVAVLPTEVSSAIGALHPATVPETATLHVLPLAA